MPASHQTSCSTESRQVEMTSHAELRAKAAAAYDAAADWYDASDNTFCERFGQRTIGRLDLRTGMCVLDTWQMKGLPQSKPT